MLVTVQHQVHAVCFEYWHKILPRAGRSHIACVRASGVRRVMKKGHAPELAGAFEITLEPAEHSAIVGNGTLQRQTRIQRYKVYVVPVEGVVAAPLRYG